VVVGAEVDVLDGEDALMQGTGALQVTLDSQDMGEAARPSSEDVACWLVGALGQSQGPLSQWLSLGIAGSAVEIALRAV
jgi:hypothetical protein